MGLDKRLAVAFLKLLAIVLPIVSVVQGIIAINQPTIINFLALVGFLGATLGFWKASTQEEMAGRSFLGWGEMEERSNIFAMAAGFSVFLGAFIIAVFASPNA